MIDTWNPAKLNEKISGRDSWNPAILNEAVTDRDSWNPAILNESAGETPVVFEATITATFPEGATCTATDGTTTLTADDNPMAFSIPNEGTWDVACVANGVTFSEDVVITTNGQTETVNLTPDGETVTPTDSVPILIACAGIGDSTYTTISEVIADSELLTEITTNDNTIAYLVRSTTFADSIAADEDAMTAIGASNECSDALLGNSTWLDVINNSAYFTSVLNVGNPTMTSNTAPSGTCSARKTASGYYPYYAFDNKGNTVWYDNNNPNNNTWIQYQFESAIKAKKISITSTAAQAVSDFTLNASNDGNTWTALTTGTGDGDYAFINDTDYAYYRLNCKSVKANGDLNIIQINIYGRVDV